MKLIIAGSRGFGWKLTEDGKTLILNKEHKILGYKELAEYLDRVTTVISGGARGADRFGMGWAVEHKIPLEIFRAAWDMHGMAAGPIRNQKMGDYADELVAFWDGKSKGTQHMINYMRSLNKPVKVVMFK